MSKLTALRARLVLSALLPSVALTPAEALASGEGMAALYDGLEYRFVGPYRGGRALAVSGVVGDPLTYYMGGAGGGVWKTTDAGASWSNVSDKDFGTGSIGAIAVAPSDPNVVWVGTGESPIRGVTTSHGDGVYRSTDGGASFQHLGLEATRQISALVVHPRDPDTAWVAAQGNPWGANPERGIYKTDDGGASWRRVLFVDEDTGASDLVIDPANPRILYAAMWHHRRSPWFITSGDASGGIYKSVDGGENWAELRSGLPEVVGKIGVAVSADDPGRVYAIVEAEEGGLFVSEDGGSSFTRRNGSRLIQARAWYYNHIGVDPEDANTVYIMNAPLLKSVDGGRTFAPMRAPHGDHHDMWFNPADGDNFIGANDGGATVTFDGGESWSPIYNQPTAQFYRVITDNLRPYTIYGGQQDNTALAIKSDAFDGAIGPDDQFTIGGGESAHVAFDEDDPRLIYATSINATLTEYDAATERVRPIKPYPEYTFGRNPSEHKYRYNWNAPVTVSQHDPDTIYYGAQVLLRSTDRGESWAEVSPDLTRDEPEKQGLNGGPITNEQAGAETYNTIFTITESPHQAGVIWVGSDDGLVHLSRDGGESWANVTPPAMPEALVNSIEVSPHDPSTVYVVGAAYKLDDFAPYVFRTTDAGKSWKRIDAGLPGDNFVRVVREDPVREGLLFAGTEGGAFASWDGGGSWQSLALNLPPVPITDMTVRHGDLVVATQGRGFYVLDDLGPLREGTEELARTPLHLFAPGEAERYAGGRSSAGTGDPTAPAAPKGAVLSYRIHEDLEDADGPLTITISDSDGEVVRVMSSEETDHQACQVRNQDPRSPVRFDRPEASPGFHRHVWDFRRDPFTCAEGVKLFAGLAGPRVPPGTYDVTLSFAGHEARAPLVVTPDPRAPAKPAAFAEQDRVLTRASGLLDTLLSRVSDVRNMQDVIGSLTEQHGDAEIASLAGTATQALDDWLATVTQPRHETFDDDINWPNMLDVQLRHLVDAIDRAGPPVTAGARQRLADLSARWAARSAALDETLAEVLPPLNDALDARSGGDAVVMPVASAGASGNATGN